MPKNGKKEARMKLWVSAFVAITIFGRLALSEAVYNEVLIPPSSSQELTIATFQFPIGEPVTVVSGDFNNDGYDELFLITETNRPRMTVGPQGITFSPSPGYELRFWILHFRENGFGEPLLVDAISTPDQKVITGKHKPIVIDLDNDGNLDVVVLLFLETPPPENQLFGGFETRLLIYWGQGNCTFIQTEVFLELAYLPFIDFALYNHVAVGDFNSDGLLDLAFLDSRYVRLQILYNLGNRNFSDPEYVWVQLDEDECLPVPISIHAQKDVIIVAGLCGYSENEFDFFVRTIKRSQQNGWEYSPLFLRNFRVKDAVDAIWDMEVADVNADGELDILFFGPSELADPSIPRFGPKYVGFYFVGLYLVKGKDYEKIAKPEFVAWVEKGTFLSVETGVDGGMVIIVLPETGIRYKHLWVVSSSGPMTSSRTVGGRGHLVDGVLINRSATRELILLASVDFESEITLINVLRGW